MATNPRIWLYQPILPQSPPEYQSNRPFTISRGNYQQDKGKTADF